MQLLKEREGLSRHIKEVNSHICSHSCFTILIILPQTNVPLVSFLVSQQAAGESSSCAAKRSCDLLHTQHQWKYCPRECIPSSRT